MQNKYKEVTCPSIAEQKEGVVPWDAFAVDPHFPLSPSPFVLSGDLSRVSPFGPEGESGCDIFKEVTREALQSKYEKLQGFLSKNGLGTSDGSSADYYRLPNGATELQDIISFKNMNAQIGEIFRACMRYGQVDHSPMLRDINKIIFYAQEEKKRLEKYGW